ncbi:MAG: signal peptide peptidase SppA [bacterium]
MKTTSWIILFVGIVFIAAAIAFFIVLTAGGLLPEGRGGGLSLGKKVGLIEITGTIIEPTEYVGQITDFGEDSSIRALVVRVESPGGGVAASQEIYEALRNVRDSGTPVIVSMGGIAASGGYYVACGADSILANPGTLTGSIGVIMNFPMARELMRKVGLEWEVLKTGEFKDTGSFARPMTDRERALLEEILFDVYDQFVSVVSTERNMTVDEVKKIADGSVYTGRQALEMGLVDRLGGLRDAIDLAADMGGISGKPTVVKPRKDLWTIWDLIEELVGTASRMANSSASLEYSFR